MDISERIRVLRKRKGLTQDQLGDLLGVSYMTVRRWETGKTSPKSEEMKKMAEVLNTSVDYLIGLTDSETLEQPLKQLLNSLSSLAKNGNINKEENNNLKVTPFLDDMSSPPELGVAYWGSVVDNAQRVAKSGSVQDREVALMMLRMATDAITGAGSKPITEKHGANIHADIIDNSGNVKQAISTTT